MNVLHRWLMILTAFWLTVGMVNVMFANQRDSLALVALHQALDGPNWNTSWNFDDPIDTWFGVQTNADGDVVVLDLGGNGLKGQLPEEIGFLSELITLKLEFNQINGELPEALGILLNLRSFVAFGNDIGGALPDTIVNLTRLEQISLSDNNLIGSIPERIGQMQSLQMLILDRNDLTGSLPASLGACSEMTFLALNDNAFDGTVPAEMGGLKKLRECLLFNNQFQGEIPEEWASMDSLQFFWIYGNRFTGKLPNFVGTKLNSIRVNNNQFSALPDFTNLNLGSGFPEGLSVENNLLSFDDIILNLPLNQSARFSYRPQDTLGSSDIVYANQGDRLQVILPFDDTLTSSVYRWFKDGDLNQLINQNALIINNIQKDDEGMYFAEVRNNVVQDLVLFTKTFQVVVRDSISCDEPPAGENCSGGPTFCSVEEMDLYCGSLPIALDTMSCLTLGLSQEARWIGWIADSSYLSLEMLPFSCSDLEAGIQWELYQNCSARLLKYCEAECTNLNRKVEFNDLIPGESYYLAIRSCGGSCKYQVRIASGGEGVRPEIGDIAVADTLCSLEEFELMTLPDASGSLEEFYWILDEDTTVTADAELSWRPDSVGLYEWCVFGVSDCDTSDLSCKTIHVFDGPKIQDVRTRVVRNDSFYVVEFRVQGGVGNIFIDSLGGTYNTQDNQFTSELIRCGQPYVVVVRDESGCAEELSGLEVCNCSSEAGLIPTDVESTCGNGTVRVGPPSGFSLDSNDATTYVILDQQTFNISNILTGASSGMFAFDSMLYQMDRVYYGFHLVGNRQGGGVDFFDPCLSHSNAQPVIWYSEPEANAGMDARYCQNTFFLRARLSRTSATGQWTQVAGPTGVVIDDDQQETTNVRVQQEGIYEFEWTEMQTNCAASDTVTIVILPEIQGEIVGPDSLCSGQIDTLKLSRSFDRYVWDTGDTSSTLAVNAPGQYCVEVFRDQLCSKRICKLIKDAIVSAPEIMGDLSICDGEKTRLQVIPEYQDYEWTNGEDRFFIEVDTPGTYCITVTDFSGCQATDCVVVISDGSRKTTIVDTLCFGDSLMVLDTVLKTSGEYIITQASSGDCDTVVEVQLVVYPEIFISDSLIVRDDGSGNGSISVNIRGGAPPYQYLWNTGATIPFISDLDGGIYSLLVTDQNDCTQIFTFDIRKSNSVADVAQGLWTVSPNPVSEEELGIYLQEIQSSVGRDLQYYWVDLQGRTYGGGQVQYSSKKGSKSGFIPISGLSQGVYLLYVNESAQQLQQIFKVVIVD